MSTRTRLAAALIAAPLLFAGCASSASHTPAGQRQMTPGMVMPDGSTMGAMAAGDTAAQPSAAAKMICSDETGSDIAAVLHLPTKPSGTASWHAPHYMCTYSLPMGTLVLSVHEAASASSAATYVAGLRQQLHATIAPGLTAQSYRTADGQVIVLKDNDVLHVDATGLPAEFGTQHEKRTDFAYEIASDILGCWTGDHS